MHFCLGCVTNHKPNSIRNNLLQLGLSLLIVIATPFIITAFNQTFNYPSLDSIRNSSPYKTYSQSIDYGVGKVVGIVSEKMNDDSFSFQKIQIQSLQIQLESGRAMGTTITQDYPTDGSDPKQKAVIGDQLVIRIEPKVEKPNENYYYIQDKYRVSNIFWLLLIFIVLVFALSGTRGLSSVLGMVFTIIVLVQLLIPGIITNQDLIGLTFWVGLLICSVSIYLGHGFNKRTTVSLVASVLTITLSTVIAIWAVDFARLTGYGTDGAFELKGAGVTGGLNLRGLLLSGIVIGSIGILDDVTTAQSVAIEEISKANPSLSTADLFWRGMIVGREHMVSLINTLALAYVGQSLPLLLMFTAYNFSPIWVIINDQLISEEIVRSLVGSTCLLMAIPICNYLAARFLKAKPFAKPVFSMQDKIRDLAKK